MLPHQAQNISRNFTMKNLVIESSSKTVHLKKIIYLKIIFLNGKKSWLDLYLNKKIKEK